MIYRLATNTDIPKLTALVRSTQYYDDDVDAADWDGVVAVAERDGELLACMWAAVCGRHAYLDYVAVKPDCQHQGIGPRLAAWFATTLKAGGVQRVRWIVAPDNTEVQKLSVQGLGAQWQPAFYFQKDL